MVVCCCHFGTLVLFRWLSIVSSLGVATISCCPVAVTFDRVLIVSAEDNILLSKATALIRLCACCWADMETSLWDLKWDLKDLESIITIIQPTHLQRCYVCRWCAVDRNAEFQIFQWVYCWFCRWTLTHWLSWAYLGRLCYFVLTKSMSLQQI